jgi:hypothetical protein
MPVPRPPKGLRWVVKQPSMYDLLNIILASVVAISSANYAAQNRPGLALIGAFATVGILLLTFVKHGITLAAARRKDSTHELEGCLYTLHAVLYPPNAESSLKLRLAIHVPVGSMLEQVTEYIGVPPKTGRIGRQYPANAGIIGKAYREHDTFVGRRANVDYQLYVQELVTEWNYTPEQARWLNPAVMEWMAVPFYSPEQDRVEAILFLDATARGFFTRERQELVLAAQSGIARFVGKRYI